VKAIFLQSLKLTSNMVTLNSVHSSSQFLLFAHPAQYRDNYTGWPKKVSHFTVIIKGTENL